MNVLIIGLGSIARKHLAAFRQLPEDFNFYALRSSPDATHEPGVQDVFSWDELPVAIDFAIISSPTDRHTESVRQCVALEIPFILEKPLAHSLEGLEELNTTIKAIGLPTYIACNLRFLPVLQFLKENLGGRINEVNVYCGSSLPNWRPGTDYRHSYSADENRGGGVHLDLFHELDYLCWIFGYPSSSYGIYRNASSIGIRAADYAHYLLHYPDFTAAATLNYYRKDTKRAIEILFSDGTWMANLLTGTITDANGTAIFAHSGFTIADTYLEQARHFLQVLRGKAKSLNPFSESLDILRICLSSEKLS